MFLTLLVLVCVVTFSLVIIFFISNSSQKDRELASLRDEHNQKLIARLEELTVQVDERQISLDHKLDALSSFIDERNTYVTFQQEQFKSLAKSEMLTAQRSELNRTRELKMALERLVGVSTLSRQPPSVQDMQAIDSLTMRIKELEIILGVRTNSEPH